MSCATPHRQDSLGPSNLTNADTLLGKNRIEIFNRFVKHIDETALNYPARFERLNTAWEQRLKRPRERFISAKSTDDVFYAIRSLLLSILDGHTSITVPEYLKPKRASVELPIEFLPLYDHGRAIYVVSKSKDREVQPGDELMKYNGHDLSDSRDEAEEWLTGNSPERRNSEFNRWLWMRKSQDMPTPDIGSRYSLEFLRGKSRYAVELTWGEHNEIRQFRDCGDILSSFHPLDYEGHSVLFRGLNYCVYSFPGKIAVVRYSSFLYDYDFDHPAEFEELLSRISYDKNEVNRDRNGDRERLNLDQTKLIGFLRKFHASRIVLDVRENRGGTPGFPLISAFAKGPFQLDRIQVLFGDYVRRNPSVLDSMIEEQRQRAIVKEELKQNPNFERSSVLPFYCLSAKCSADEATMTPTEELANINLWIVTGPFCASACDQFVAMLRENGIGKVVGLASDGSSSPIRIKPEFTLANGDRFSMTLPSSFDIGPDGHPIEAHPAPLDKRVPPTRQNYREYISSVIRETGG